MHREKSGTIIHFHALLWKRLLAVVRIHSVLDRALAAANMEQLEQLESESAKEFAEVLREELAEVTALHPAGRAVERREAEECATEYYRLRKAIAEANAGGAALTPDDEVRRKHFVVGNDVAPNELGNVYRWPAHEGCAEMPSSRSLRERVFRSRLGYIFE